MFYDTAADDHGLPRNPFKACVAPRPIGWISTLSAGGIANLAPYSFFNGMGSAPPVVVFGSNNPGPGGPKDSLRNIEQTGEFVVNIATITLKEQMNATSATLPPEVDEFIHAGLEKAASRLVKPPRVAASPIHLECRHMQTVRLPTTAQFPDAHNAAVFGLVVGVHIDESVLTDGLIDAAKVGYLSRLGYMDYAVTSETFAMRRPK